jgi:autotransporter-associated beta strand protein
LVGGNEGLKLAYSTGAPNLVVTNGILRFVLGAGAAPANYTSVNFASGVAFASGAGMIVGSNVFVTFAGSSVFAGGLPSVVLEEGGYWNLGALSGPQNASPIRSLAGLGTVTCIATNTNGNTPALSVSNSVGELSEFAGSVTDGFNLNSVLGTTCTNTVLVSISKSGASTQILSGSNNYSGLTTISAGELRFSKRKSLYAGNTSLWNKISVTNGAIIGLNLTGSDPFTASDFQTLASDANNTMKAGAYFGVGVSSLDYPSGLSTNLYYVNAANPGGIGLAKSGNGNLTLTGLPASNSVPLLITGGKLALSGVSTFAGSPAISGGGILDLGGATFPIPNSVTLTDGSMVNFTAGVADPFAPTSNPSYTGFSFSVNNLNGNGKTFYLTNSTLTVNGNVDTNAFNLSGSSSGIMRLTGSTLGQGDTNVSRGQISVQGSAVLEFASNSVFDSYRVLSVNSASNPTILVSGGNVSNLGYVIFGSGAANSGTLRITGGSLSTANPSPSQNGFYFGQSGGTGTFRLEGGSASTTVLKVQSGAANINISGGTLNLVTTNAATNPASGWSLSQNGTVNFTMSGGSVSAPNSRFNLSTGNSGANIITNVSYLQSGGTISSVEMSAGAGSFTMNGGTNESSAGLFVGDNPYGAASFTQNGGLVRIKGEAGSQAANDLVIGAANGNGTYVLNGGVLEVFGKIRKNSGTGVLILNGGIIRYTNNANQTAFISSFVDTRVGTGGAIFEITDSNVTNSIQATLSDVSGQVGNLVKRGPGALSIGRPLLNYTGSTLIEDGKLVVTNTNFTAEIANNAVNMTLNPVPDVNTSSTNSYSILPGVLQGGTTTIVAPQLASNQSITFDPLTAIAKVVTTVAPPVITSASSFSSIVGVSFSGQMTASGALPITFSGINLPAGISVNSNGLISGTPTVAGSFTATLTGTNAGGATDQTCTFTVAKGTPVITSVPTAAAVTEGQPLSSSALSGGSATGANGTVLDGTFAWASGGTILSATGSYDVTFTPTSSNYKTATQTVIVTVNPAGQTIEGFLNGQPTNAENLRKYAIGGATDVNSPSEAPVLSLDATKLSLTAIVRTNDNKLTVVGEVANDLTSWSTAGVTMTVSSNTDGVPAGCQRQVFSVDRANSPSKQFLRLKATLQP